MVHHVIIMAGGAGQRLWPASVHSHPKQFMEVESGYSLLGATLKRAFAVSKRGLVVIVTHQDHLDLAYQECLRLPDDARQRIGILPEPQGRNTAPALALAASWLASLGQGGETSLVLAADHLIEPLEAFRDDVKKAGELAHEDFFIVFGVPPTHPETGYGYIEKGGRNASGFFVLSFKEKPSAEKAAFFLASKRFLWNSGMFCYKTDLFLRQLALHEPEMHATFASLPWERMSFQERDGIRSLEVNAVLRESYARTRAISFDHAILEKSRQISLVEASFSWNDIGSWDALAQLSSSTKGDTLLLDAKRNFVYSDLPVALCGVSDLLVVIQNGTALICRRGSSQKVKELVSRLQEKDTPQAFPR